MFVRYLLSVKFHPIHYTTKSHELAAFKDVAGEPGNYTFLNDPEACPWAIYHWFKEYAEMDE